MALTTTARPVLESTVVPISQKFVRATARRSGMRPGLYRIRADREWRRLRDEYIQATIAELENAGLKRVPAPRKRRFATELRFTWAVLHRCCGKSIDELADEYREETETIRISVSRILKDLGFESPT